MCAWCVTHSCSLFGDRSDVCAGNCPSDLSWGLLGVGVGGGGERYCLLSVFEADWMWQSPHIAETSRLPSLREAKEIPLEGLLIASLLSPPSRLRTRTKKGRPFSGPPKDLLTGTTHKGPVVRRQTLQGPRGPRSPDKLEL